MNFLSLIESKRDGQPLTAAQLGEMVADIVSRQLPDYQLAAFLTTVFFQGLNPAETTALTLDKLDSIPDFQTELPIKPFVEIVQEVGCVICGETGRMVPADKKLYAPRDFTGIVPGIPLITA